MSKILLIALHEYRANVIKRSFLLTLLSLPLFLAFTIGSGIIAESISNSDVPVGYVDQSGVIDPGRDYRAVIGEDAIEIRRFDSEAEARAALEAEEIQAYYVLGADYLSSGDVRLTFLNDISQNARSNFFDFLQFHLMQDMPAPIVERIILGTDVNVTTPDSGRSYPDGGPPFSVTLPLIVSAAFVFLLMMSAGYAMGAVAGERESRTMEVLITSVSPGRLVRGKLLGIIGISLTLLVCWSLIGFGAFLIGREVFDLRWFREAQIDWGGLATVMLVALPNYISAIALMVMVGSTIAEMQEGQALSGLFILIFFLPIYAMTIIGEHPQGTFSIVLSTLPFTSLLTTGLRNLVAVIPINQVILSFLAQTIFAALAIWFAGRAFRLGMLRYGQRIRLKELLPRRAGTRAGRLV